MIINKFQGKTEEEAKSKARETLGSAAVIMNVKEIRPKGVLGIFKSSTYEVTAAIEEDDYAKAKAAAASSNPAPKFDAVVSDVGASSQSRPVMTGIEAASASKIDETSLKDAFSEINKLLGNPTQENDAMSNSNQDNNVQQAPVAHSEQRTVPQNNAPAHPTNSKLNAYKAGAATAPKKENNKEMVPLAESAERIQTAADPNAVRSETYSNMAPMKTVSAPQPVAQKQTERSRMDIEDSVRANEPNNYSVVKMLYNELLDNEVQEKYINQVLDDMDKILATSHSLDNLLSSVYQKMVLKLGRPNTITVGGKRPRIVFFIGPTGVGKTTTIAKIASKFKLEEGRKVGLITSDTYRMAAADQLRTYANILNVPMSVIYSADELNECIKNQVRSYDDLDLILVDTLGFSHKNDAQKEDLKELLDALDENYEKEVYLVLSATTKYRDLIDITDAYSEFTGYSIIFTKLDETACYGNIYNIKQRTGASLSYFTAGQNVPDDIDCVDIQKLVKQLLGGS